MKRRRLRLVTLALVGALLALGVSVVAAAGHYAGAAWDAPLQRQIMALFAALDLGNPTIIVAALSLGVSVLLFTLAAVRYARLKVAPPPDEEEQDAPARARAPVESGPVVPAGVEAFTTVLYFDLE